jgi:YfiH family protein
MLGIVGDAAGLELVPGFDQLGVIAFTTTRQMGSFGTLSDESVRDVTQRWDELRATLAPFGTRLATARQVHGARVVEHVPGWDGWLRGNDADGHLSAARGTGMAVTIADCVPIFIAHPSGAAALLHSGWRGTAARIVDIALRRLVELGFAAGELHVHLGPAICGNCYEVSPDVYARLTGREVTRPTTVDLREVIASHAAAAGVREITTSPWCTRCDNDRFFSHRAGDWGRQLGVLIAAT